MICRRGSTSRRPRRNRIEERDGGATNKRKMCVCRSNAVDNVIGGSGVVGKPVEGGAGEVERGWRMDGEEEGRGG
jgi:hypothetical protein